MNEILFLSGLLVAVSGLFLIGGYLEHKKSLLILDNISDLALMAHRIIQKWDTKCKERRA